MTDEELQLSWPDLGALVLEVRRIDSQLADRLVDAVQYSSTSGEIHSSVGRALEEARALQKKLTPSGVQAWRRVMADIDRRT